MTNLQIRTKIAEILGWKPDDDGAGLNTWEASWAGNKLYGLKPRFDDSGKLVSYTIDCVVPNFPEDLNACHEFAAWLDPEQQIQFAEELQFIVLENPSRAWWNATAMEVFQIADATARQRCEAFLRVHNQWEE